jgi:hypothetical protein
MSTHSTRQTSDGRQFSRKDFVKICVKLNGAHPPRLRSTLIVMPLSKLAKSFLEQLEREHGAILVHICCKCEPDSALVP